MPTSQTNIGYVEQPSVRQWLMIGDAALLTMRSGGLASVLPAILKLSVKTPSPDPFKPAPICVILQVIESIGSDGAPN
jgi:hypothetical protein